MGSSLAWLDSSRADQQRMRELINMFSQQESLDELGIGQVRDAFSDLLFPGTSSLHTRARYLLIVPWCYQAAERRRATGTALEARVVRIEQEVIGSLTRADVTDGVIGRRVGVAVKTLPSTIYWTALATFGIRRGDESGAWFGSRATTETEADELAERATGMWHPTTPPVPSGFPYDVPGGLDLDRDEAQWLRDRILAGTTGTLLAHLVGDVHRPFEGSSAPWEDPAVLDAPAEPAADLRHAELFSLAMHGAARLYNLLLGERYEQAGYTDVDAPVETYRDLLDDWAAEIAERHDLAQWDRSDMWSRVIAVNPRIATNHTARAFMETWLSAVVDGSATTAANSDHLRRLVEHRERTVKRAQSRFVNERMLRTWSGASGSRRLTFRWPNVRRLVTDVHVGTDREPADAAA